MNLESGFLKETRFLFLETEPLYQQALNIAEKVLGENYPHQTL